ncbi:hypothetical protein KSC_105570 [Ktedonobacter sp. SOSP1-52]|nr:hypothetical protein KSC_105570 [Ktedonobacter sp. SOSP1-52]
MIVRLEPLQQAHAADLYTAGDALLSDDICQIIQAAHQKLWQTGSIQRSRRVRRA